MDRVLHEYSIHGLKFRVSEVSDVFWGKRVATFTIDSAGDLEYDKMWKFSPAELIEAIDMNLPDWVGRSREHGKDLSAYDPRAPIELVRSQG